VKIGAIVAVAVGVAVAIGVFSSVGLNQDNQQQDQLEREVQEIIEAGKIVEEQEQKPAGIENKKDTETFVLKKKEVEVDYYCSNECYTGHVTRIIDGDTIWVDDQSVRFSLVDTPEMGYYGYEQARDLIASICPVGSAVVLDVDDWQILDIYGRYLAIVYCNEVNLNEVVLEEGLAVIDTFYCSQSEFSELDWAQKYGCKEQKPAGIDYGVGVPAQPKASKPQCDPSYPDFCIPSPPPDLDCKDIPSNKFTVLQPDPHRFDGDKDGIGCESSSKSTSTQSTTKPNNCDPSYPDFCIPSPPPDLDCKDIPQKRFTVIGSDPHRFDGDKDGIGCES